jgi:large repetitive protein
MKKSMAVPMYVFLLCLLMGCGGAVGRAPSQALTIISAAPPDGTVGATYAGTQGFSFSATGGVAPYVWSWTAAVGSSLPPGLSLLSEAGVISGTPATVGVYIFTVSVRDSTRPPFKTA